MESQRIKYERKYNDLAEEYGRLEHEIFSLKRKYGVKDPENVIVLDDESCDDESDDENDDPEDINNQA
jgi:Ran GTPase-activating protein (RanGAP) involved in mRNA processing and transport